MVVGGVLPPSGATVFEQMQALRADDSLRRLLLREPRGSVAVHANLIVPATRADCDAGYIIMEPTEYPAMSGSNTICVATVLLETGMVEMQEPETTLRLEAPGGVVEVRARCRGGRVRERRADERACFAERLDAPLEVDGLGTLTVDVAYGGMWYAIADAAALGFALEPHEARDLSPSASGSGSPRASSCRACIPRTPRSPASASSRSPSRGRASARRRRTRSSSRPGRLDRSATGTGLSARHGGAARARADARRRRDDARVGDRLDVRRPHRRRDEVGGGRRSCPAIRGSAWITGITQLYVDPDDPFPEGYLLSDTWPGDDLQSLALDPRERLRGGRAVGRLAEQHRCELVRLADQAFALCVDLPAATKSAACVCDAHSISAERAGLAARRRRESRGLRRALLQPRQRSLPSGASRSSGARAARARRRRVVRSRDRMLGMLTRLVARASASTASASATSAWRRSSSSSQRRWPPAAARRARDTPRRTRRSPRPGPGPRRPRVGGGEACSLGYQLAVPALEPAELVEGAVVHAAILRDRWSTWPSRTRSCSSRARSTRDPTTRRQPSRWRGTSRPLSAA